MIHFRDADRRFFVSPAFFLGPFIFIFDGEALRFSGFATVFLRSAEG